MLYALIKNFDDARKENFVDPNFQYSRHCILMKFMVIQSKTLIDNSFLKILIFIIEKLPKYASKMLYFSLNEACN